MRAFLWKKLRYPVFCPDALSLDTLYREHNLPTTLSFKVIVVTGETGSGKSTQLPQYLYESGWLNAATSSEHPLGATLAVTQPRRVAALTLATRVADEKGWKLGQRVGYAIRFEECRTPNVTVITYLTEGMLIHEMLRDPLLSRFRVIMLDEVHERSLQTDILLGLIKKVLRKRPYDFRVIVSSATLEAKRYIEYFSDLKLQSSSSSDKSGILPVALLNVEGRQFPVSVFYSIDPVPCYIRAAKETVFKIHESRPPGGDILVFVTGQQEVMQLTSDIVGEYRDRKSRSFQQQPTSSSKSSQSTYPNLRCLPLHGSLGQSDQLRIFDRPTRQCRKVVVATNIAEASVTLPGISYVIDCGLGRLKAYNPLTGLEVLVTGPISQASAQQRAGRAGRTRAGEAYRLYPEHVYTEQLARFTPPEAVRTDLSGALLRLKTLGIDKLGLFDWIDRPPKSHVSQAAEKLVALGALDPLTGRLDTTNGIKLAELSVACGLDQPGAAAALLGSCDEGCSKEVASIIALAQIQKIFITIPGQVRTGDKVRRQLFGCREGDHLTELNALTAYEKQAGKSTRSDLRQWCRQTGLNGAGLAHALVLRDRIGAAMRRLKLPWVEAEPPGNAQPSLRSLVRGYFYQVARLVPNSSHYLTVRGDHRLRLHPNCILYASSAKWPKWILFTNVFLTTADSSSGDSLPGDLSPPICVSGVSAIQPDWLLELAGHYYRFGTDRELVERALTSDRGGD